MDSRAPIEIVLDQGIGDMFSLRTAGNVVDEDVLGGLEYAAKVTGASSSSSSATPTAGRSRAPSTTCIWAI